MKQEVNKIAVDTKTYGQWTTHTGTLAEVMAAVYAMGVPRDRVNVVYNGTNVSAIVYGQ